MFVKKFFELISFPLEAAYWDGVAIRVLLTVLRWELISYEPDT